MGRKKKMPIEYVQNDDTFSEDPYRPVEHEKTTTSEPAETSKTFSFKNIWASRLDISGRFVNPGETITFSADDLEKDRFSKKVERMVEIRMLKKA
jgi:hypothetical protein